MCAPVAEGAGVFERTSPDVPERRVSLCRYGSTEPVSTSPTGRCSRSGSVPPAASNRKKCDFPLPFAPRTATRSPNQISASKRRISPVSSRSVTHDRALSGTATPQAHGHALLSRGGLGRACFLEPPQTRLCRLVSTRSPSL